MNDWSAENPAVFYPYLADKGSARIVPEPALARSDDRLPLVLSLPDQQPTVLIPEVVVKQDEPPVSLGTASSSLATPMDRALLTQLLVDAFVSRSRCS